MNNIRKLTLSLLLVFALSFGTISQVLGSSSSYQDGTLTPWTPTLVGWGTTPPTFVYNYMVVGSTVFFYIFQGGASVSNATNATISLPIPAATIAGMNWYFSAQVTDNGTVSATPGMCFFASAATVMTCGINWQNAAWTNSGVKLIRVVGSYQI